MQLSGVKRAIIQCFYIAKNYLVAVTPKKSAIIRIVQLSGVQLSGDYCICVSFYCFASPHSFVVFTRNVSYLPVLNKIIDPVYLLRLPVQSVPPPTQERHVRERSSKRRRLRVQVLTSQGE